MNTALTRRSFLAHTATAAWAASVVPHYLRAADTPFRPAPGFPLVDFHVHLDNSTIDNVLALPQAATMKFGIVEHAGTKENQYPAVLSTDGELLANVSWLPAPLAGDDERFWTPARIKKVVDAAVQYRVAFEISASFKLPKLSFLKAAKAAGVKLCLGSNGRYPNMGKLDYALSMVVEPKLTGGDLFTPAPDGQKAVQRRKW